MPESYTDTGMRTFSAMAENVRRYVENADELNAAGLGQAIERIEALESGQSLNVDEVRTETLFVTLKSDTTKVIAEPDTSGLSPDEITTQEAAAAQINYEIIYVPPFWPELETSAGSGSSLDDLAAIQAALKADGEKLQGAINAV